jgi:uncharacterized coiled-coil protein SlyX
MSFTAENTIFDRMRALEERVLQQEKIIQEQQNTILEHQHKLVVHDTKLSRIMSTIYQIIGKVFCQATEMSFIYGLENYMNYGVRCTTRWLCGNDEEGVYEGNIPDEPVDVDVDMDDVFEEEKYYDFTETSASNGNPRPCLTRQSHIPETPRKMSQVPICLDLSMDEQNELYTDDDVFEEEKYFDFTETPRKMSQVPICLDLSMDEQNELYTDADWHSFAKQMQEDYESPHANLPLDMEEGEIEETEETDNVGIYKQLHSLKLNSYAMRGGREEGGERAHLGWRQQEFSEL